MLTVVVILVVSAALMLGAAWGIYGSLPEKVEGFIEDLFAYETFEFLPGTLFTAVALGGAILAIVATGLTALGAVLFNLISDLVGGVRLTMVELPGAKPAVRPRKAARLAAKAVPASDD